VSEDQDQASRFISQIHQANGSSEFEGLCSLIFALAIAIDYRIIVMSYK